MAGFWKEVMGKVSGDRDDDFDDYDETSYDTSSSAVTEREADYSSNYEEPRGSFSSSKAISLRNVADSPKLYIMKPSGYDEVMTGAVDMLREGTIIFLNLNGIDQEIGTRIVDFMTGVAAAFEGRIKKVDTCCYAVAPKNIDWISSIDD